MPGRRVDGVGVERRGGVLLGEVRRLRVVRSIRSDVGVELKGVESELKGVDVCRDLKARCGRRETNAGRESP